MSEDFKSQICAMAAESVELCSVPLVHVDRNIGRAVDIRSGVLIEIGCIRFLVTAAHGMIAHENAGHIFQMVQPEKGSNAISLLDERFLSTIDPKEDLCVCQLSDASTTAMGDRFKYLRLTELMLSNDAKRFHGLYMLLGFPNAMGNLDDDGAKRIETWRYLTTQYNGDYSRVEEYCNELHLVLDYDRATYSREGRTVHPPGLSGCGVFFVGSPVDDRPVSSRELRLVAIQTSWHKGEQYSKCTWIDHVLRVIWRYYRDTRAPMTLHDICF